MKKLILSMALLAGMTFVACSDDDGDKKSNSNCVTCDAYTIQGVTAPEQTICKGENGNAFINNQDTGMSYTSAVEAMEMMTDCN
ncbi:hypothetical protein [Flavobacterium suzhouense]|uniref:Lipoprotein n=1 Tax=Flavobacterium suzhouense TaxID=1529638 RepID=A0ABW5NR05_9FLAO